MDAIAELMAIKSHTPSGAGGSGRLRFLFRCGGVMIAEGRNTSPLAVVCVCIVFIGDS